MKKTIVLLAFIAFTSIYSSPIFAQSKIVGQTTLEEYNYVTKGYKVQIESGLDMKNGYGIVNVDKQSTEERTAELKMFYRIKDEKKEIAAYMIVYNKTGGSKEYICVPHPGSDAEITSKYWSKLYSGSGDSSQRLQLISYLLSRNLVW